MTRHHQDLEFLFRDECGEPHVYSLMGILDPRENVVSLSTLPLYRIGMVWDIVLKKESKEKLQTFVMIASKTSGKSTYASWLKYFYEGKGSQSLLVLEAYPNILATRSVLPSKLEDALNFYVFPCASSLPKGKCCPRAST